MWELHEEQLSASDDDDEEGHNIWNVFLVTNCNFGNRIQSNLADEEVGRVGLSCQCALDCLCAELYTF